MEEDIASLKKLYMNNEPTEQLELKIAAKIHEALKTPDFFKLELKIFLKIIDKCADIDSQTIKDIISQSIKYYGENGLSVLFYIIYNKVGENIKEILESFPNVPVFMDAYKEIQKGKINQSNEIEVDWHAMFESEKRTSKKLEDFIKNKKKLRHMKREKEKSIVSELRKIQLNEAPKEKPIKVSNNKAIVNVVKQQNMEKLQKLIFLDPNIIFAKDNDSNKNLLWIAYRNNWEDGFCFIAHKAAYIESILDSEMQGQTLLAKTILSGKVKMFKALVDNGADIEKKDTMGSTPIMYASSVQDLFFMKYLFLKRVNIESINENGYTPLLNSAKHKQTESAKLLLELGANTEATGKDGKSVWDIAYENKDIDIIYHLITREERFDFKNEQILELMIEATISGHTEMIEFLKSKGNTLSVKLLDGGEGTTKLFEFNGVQREIDIEKLCITSKSKYFDNLINLIASKSERDDIYVKLMESAYNSSNLEMFNFLLNHGAVVTFKDLSGFDVLYYIDKKLGTDKNQLKIREIVINNFKNRITKAVEGTKPDVTMILFGSNRSAIIRQVKYLIHDINDEEKIKRANFINVVDEMQSFLRVIDRNSLAGDISDAIDYILGVSIDIDNEINDEAVSKMTTIWANPMIRKEYEKEKFKMETDILPYFLDNNGERLNNALTAEDISYLQMCENDVLSTTFNYESKVFRLYNVAGKKCFRKYFEESKFLIVLMPLNNFDIPSFEYDKIMGIQNNIENFKILTNSPTFNEKYYYLIATGLKLFEEKICNTDSFINFFPTFKGNPKNPNECAEFIVNKYVEIAKENSFECPFSIINEHNINDVEAAIKSACHYAISKF